MCNSLIPPDGKGPDLSRIESPYIPITIKLYTSKGRAELKYFDHLQLRVHYLFTLSPYRSADDRTKIYKKMVSDKIEEVGRILKSALFDIAGRMSRAGIRDDVFSYGTPTILHVMSFTRYSRQYLELLEKYDEIIFRAQIMYRSATRGEKYFEDEIAEPRKEMRRLCALIHDLKNEEVKKNQGEEPRKA